MLTQAFRVQHAATRYCGSEGTRGNTFLSWISPGRTDHRFDTNHHLTLKQVPLSSYRLKSGPASYRAEYLSAPSISKLEDSTIRRI